MNRNFINKLNISELTSFKSIIESRMNQMDFFREKQIPIDINLYEKLQNKRDKIESHINILLDLI